MKAKVLIAFMFGIHLTLVAQPLNDECTNASIIPLSPSASSISLIEGDTRGATQSVAPIDVCSQTWLSDDVWYAFTTPDSVLRDGLTIKAFFDHYSDTTDVRAIGMALYSSCDSLSPLLRCFSSDDPAQNALSIASPCLELNHTYLIRIWSAGNTTDTEGRFRLGVYVSSPERPVLWKETFQQGLEGNGWMTWGICEEPDSNHNAGWKYHADAVFDDGSYIYAGFRINSPSQCDGAVGVDSDYNHTGGIESFPPTEYCGSPSMHYLVSPPIYSGEWTSPGISLQWHQAIRNFESEHFIGYRWYDTDSTWSDWVDFLVNTDSPPSSILVTGEVQSHLLPGAAGHDSIQIRFRYVDHFYFWIIDDIALVATEANNLKLEETTYAIPPWVSIPADQADEYFALVGLTNAGAAEQHNVILQHQLRLQTSPEIVDDQSVVIGQVPPLNAETSLLIPSAIQVPDSPGRYIGSYSVTQDEPDFDTTDNKIVYSFETGGTTFAHEDGPTRSYNLQEESLFVKTNGWGYGNVFYPKEDVQVTGITFGIILPHPLPGDSIRLHLIEWEDTNNDMVAQSNERTPIAGTTYFFEKPESDWIVTTVPLVRVDGTGLPVMMQGGRIYFAMMEYPGSGIGSMDRVYVLASEARDFRPTVAAYDSAFVKGLAVERRFISVLQYSPGGTLPDIDFGLRPLGSNFPFHPGDQIVPMIRVETGKVNALTTVTAPLTLNISPNPSNGNVIVRVPPMVSQAGDILVFDAMGNRIKSFSYTGNGNIALDLTGQPDGAYFIHLCHPQGLMTAKMVIQH